MDDLNEVREVLGYQQINLIGMSYGTRAGLVYLRRHGDTVRSMVLDGVVPLSMSIPRNIAVDAQSAFEILLADCIKQISCRETFPDLREHFQGLVQYLSSTPQLTTVNHPRTGKPIKGRFHPELINRLIRTVLYDRTLSSLIPLAIEEAYKGNFQPIATLAYSYTGDGTQMSVGMMASVLCAEDMRHVSEPNDTEDFDNAIFHMLAPTCEYWPQGSIPENYFEPVSSDVPVLLLSGIFDPVTPPKYGWDAAATLSNSEHIVVPGVGHGTSLQGCVPYILEEFFDSANPKGLNAGCVSDLSRPPFFTSFAGATALADSRVEKSAAEPGSMGSERDGEEQ
jgi:pimeloyl-ACP methyl ester carboxylesterase